MNKTSKLKRNTPVPLQQPESKNKYDEGTEVDKKGSTVVGQPELTGKNNPIRQKGNQTNTRKEGDGPYTD